jgi:hypothetical protein
MLSTPHAVVGAAIAASVSNPALGLPLAFVSHFVLDKVPHYNPHLNTELKENGKVTKKSTKLILFDITLAFIMSLAIASTALPDIGRFIVIMLGALMGILPDLIEAPYYFLRKKSDFVLKWIKFQKSIQTDTSIVPGMATQVVTVIATLIWVYN